MDTYISRHTHICMDTPLSLCSHSLSPSPCATFKALSLARGDILFCLTDAGCESSFGSQYTYMQTLYSLSLFLSFSVSLSLSLSLSLSVCLSLIVSLALSLSPSPPPPLPLCPSLSPSYAYARAVSASISRSFRASRYMYMYIVDANLYWLLLQYDIFRACVKTSHHQRQDSSVPLVQQIPTHKRV